MNGGHQRERDSPAAHASPLGEGVFAYKLSDDGTRAETSPLLEMLRARVLGDADLVHHSVLEGPDQVVVDRLAGVQPWESPAEDRAVGCMLGMVLGDSIGHRSEFQSVRYGKNVMWDLPTGRGGAFQLEAGQWTDDASMGLCLADSLLVTRGALDPHDLMHRFLAWWHAGYNNAFRFDNPETSHSISMAFSSYVRDGFAYTRAGDARTSGNGSVMRNAAVPQSRTTHQGAEAAECCALLSHICARAVAGEPLRAVLSGLGGSFRTDVASVAALAAGAMEGEDADRDWRWRTEEQYRFSERRAAQQPGYVGSYAMDAMAMALNVAWRCSSVKDAVLMCANIRGDSDSFGSVAGQITGAFYGASSLPRHWVDAVLRWDNGGEIATRASRLCSHRFL
eukprot:m51a1_g10193 putative adp-ribosylation crystallin j1 (394) ;mRNA; f:23732-25613